MKITREQACKIAEDVMDIAGYHITQYAGYYEIWHDDEDPEINYAVAINKEYDDNGNDKHFAIYVSLSTEEGFWEYTDGFSIKELADKLMEIADNIDIEEQRIKEKAI